MALVITPEINLKIKELAAAGFTRKQIAADLKIKYQTIASHMIDHKILSKMQNRGRWGGRKKKTKTVVLEGFFNEHERQNWLI